MMTVADEEFFEKMKELAKAAKKKATVEESDEITPEEDVRLDYWVMDMVKHIEKNAASGKTNFTYDCSKIRTTLYDALIQRFAQKYRYFMVIRDAGRKYIIVDWSGKNEA